MYTFLLLCQNKPSYIPSDYTFNTIHRCITNQRIHACYTNVLCVYACARVPARVPMWRSGNSVPEFVLSFHRVGPWELTLSGLVISTFTGLVILPVYEYNNFIMKTRTTTKTQPALRLSVFRLLLLATFQSVLLQLRYHCPLYCREMGPVSLDPPIETIFKNINKSAMLLLHLLKDEEGPTSPQTASQWQQPCWDLLLGERNSLSSKSEKHLHSWKLDLPNMENAWVYWKKDYVRKYAELQRQEMFCLNQVPDSNQGSQSCKQPSQVRMSNFFWLLRSSSQLLWAGFLFANQKDHRKYKVSFFSYTAKSIHM